MTRATFKIGGEIAVANFILSWGYIISVSYLKFLSASFRNVKLNINMNVGTRNYRTILLSRKEYFFLE